MSIQPIKHVKVSAYNWATLANYRASKHLANAALHLVETQRGF